MNAISIKQLQFSYPGSDFPALENVDLSVKPQDIFGLLGPNGAGKTTLLSLLSGLLPCPPSSIFIDGQDISKASAGSGLRLSLVPQDYAFYQQLTVAENLNFFAAAQGLKKSDLTIKIQEVVEITGIEQRLNHSAATLSGGLKRRLNLAIGLLNTPKLLLLDEPTVGIDPHSRHFILEAIKRINHQGTTIIYTSHYMEEVEALCDQIAVVDKGKVVVQGSLQELLRSQAKSALCIDLMESPNPSQLKALSQMSGYSLDALRLNMAVSSEADIVKVLETLEHHQLRIGRIHYGARNLEELFLDITQRSLRD